MARTAYVLGYVFTVVPVLIAAAVAAIAAIVPARTARRDADARLEDLAHAAQQPGPRRAP